MWHPQMNSFASVLEYQVPEAFACISGSRAYADIEGLVLFYQMINGILVVTRVSGLPYEQKNCPGDIFGYHIHEGSVCSGNSEDPFADVKMHYNPDNCPHPKHKGDMPPLFGNHGFAFSAFYTDRFKMKDIIGRTVIIHNMPDDFKTQPSGDSGTKIACGEIKKNKNQ